MEGWVDLGTAVRVCSPYPRLYIAVAVVITNCLRWDSNLDPLTPQSGMLPLGHCDITNTTYTWLKLNDCLWVRVIMLPTQQPSAMSQSVTFKLNRSFLTQTATTRTMSASKYASKPLLDVVIRLYTPLSSTTSHTKQVNSYRQFIITSNFSNVKTVKWVSFYDMTYTVSSGMLNPTIQYHAKKNKWIKIWWKQNFKMQ